MDAALSTDRSRVAGVNALFRAVESQRSPGDRILLDPFAARLCEHDPAVWFLRLLRFAIPPLRRAIDEQLVAHCVRHRAIDALIEQAFADGFGQIVLLGAGYDTRASRLGRPGLRWFEVDRAPMLRRKARRLAGLPGVNAEVVRVSADLGEGVPLAALREAGLDLRAPTLFVIEGLLHYLSEEAVSRLLTETAAGPGPRRLVLSFITPAMVQRAGGTFRNMIRVLGEIPHTYFPPEALAAEAERAGWRHTRCWTWAEQARDFAPQALGRPCGLTQDVLAAASPQP